MMIRAHGIAVLRTTSGATLCGWLDMDTAVLIWTLAVSVPSEHGPSVGFFWTVSVRYVQLLAERASSSTNCLTGTYMARTTKNTSAVITPLEWGAYIIRPTDRKSEDLRQAPNCPGVYAWYSKRGDLMYVGRSVAIATRLRQHRAETAFTMTPRLFSFRTMPRELIAGVEVAHIDVLDPPENRYRDSFSVPFRAELEEAIEAIWRDVLPGQKARVNAAYSAYLEQIAARL